MTVAFGVAFPLSVVAPGWAKVSPSSWLVSVRSAGAAASFSGFSVTVEAVVLLPLPVWLASRTCLRSSTSVVRMVHWPLASTWALPRTVLRPCSRTVTWAPTSPVPRRVTGPPSWAMPSAGVVIATPAP
ncbi:hypothetical protein SZ60_15955 [Frigoribacterium sp. MEB024]|nr:hypothetical protein SZ60_15955 [Frigoribacterium sp. MEB024]